MTILRYFLIDTLCLELRVSLDRKIVENCLIGVTTLIGKFPSYFHYVYFQVLKETKYFGLRVCPYMKCLI